MAEVKRGGGSAEVEGRGVRGEESVVSIGTMKRVGLDGTMTN